MKYTVVDVREPEEYANGHITGAINISPSELMSGTEKLRSLSMDAEIILYCRTGSRSNVSMNIMRGMGYANLINGINEQQVKAKYGL